MLKLRNLGEGKIEYRVLILCEFINQDYAYDLCTFHEHKVNLNC